MSLALIRVGREGDGHPFIERVRALTEDEASGYLGSIEHLQDYSRTRDLFDLVEHNIGAVRTSIAQHLDRGTSARRGVFHEGIKERQILQLSVINYLSAVRLYLDHRQTHLTRRYGPKSDELRVFNEARRSEHGSHPEYAFVYELRNFVQHCGMPLQAIRDHASIAPGEEGRERLVGCSKSQLLALFSDWTHSRPFILAQAEEFPLLPVLEVMRDCLSRVEATTSNAIMTTLWRDAKSVVRLVAECSSENAVGMVGRIDPRPEDPNKFDITFRRYPQSVLAWLGLIELTEGPPGFTIRKDRLSMDAPPEIVP